MSLLQMFRSSQPVAGRDGTTLHPDFFSWLGRLLDTVRLSMVPPLGIVRAYLTASDISDNFDGDGAGNPGGVYSGWQIANGNGGSPDLTTEFAGDVIALMRVG